MGRQLRIEYPHAYYHVTARGNERKDIFKSDRDRQKFLEYLESAVTRYSAVIHSWCLMRNHYHLLVETPAGNLSQVMQHINGAYTNYFNIKRKRAGHLFQGRYKAILVDADQYALELSRYIHLNPVRVGLVSNPDDYRWSSFQEYTGKRAAETWLKRDFVLGFFANGEAQAAEKYRRFVEETAENEQESPLNESVASTILGSPEFVEFIQAQYVDQIKADRNLSVLRDTRGKTGADQIIAATEAVFGEGNKAKKVAVHLCHRYSGLKLREIGTLFGIKDSGVSQASKRLEVEMERDDEIRKAVGILRQQLKL
jgi:REP element-mobilizing transposase RayT